MTRHQRRRLARQRKDAKAEIMLRRALHVLATEKAKANLSQPTRKGWAAIVTNQHGKPRTIGCIRSPKGVVSSIYSGAANSLGFTNPRTYSKGEAK